MSSLVARVPAFLTWEAERALLHDVRGSGGCEHMRIDATGALAAPPPLDRALVYRVNEAEDAHARLLRGISAVGGVSRSAEALIGTVLRLVFLRKSDDAGSFSSSSWPFRPGVIGVVEPDRAHPDDIRLMDALVHESIHSLLYTIERSEPFYTSDGAMLARKARSPWSGRNLFLHSYVHACFVWFGLWSFWRIARMRGCYADRAASVLLERAQCGFTPHLLSALGDEESLVSPSVRDAIAAIEYTVLGSAVPGVTTIATQSVP